ncbi:MAG: response regulator transcription factor [Candidatus Sulfotelmatobacter sp.]|jgi:DNA-binding NarL/FixJ family response regulator
MELVFNPLIVAGLDRLYHEIVATALESHGWQVIDLDTKKLGNPEDLARIALIFSSGAVETIVGAIYRARAKWPGANVVLLTQDSLDSDIVRFIEAGVSACVTSSQSMAELVGTLQMVSKDEAPASGRVTELVLNNIGRITRQYGENPDASLTPRETEILRLISSGLSNKEIADHLHIAPNTVKNHVHHLLEKLKVGNRHEASWLKSRLPRGFPLAG